MPDRCTSRIHTVSSIHLVSRHGGIPFEVRVDTSNRVTRVVIEEARRISVSAV